MILMFPPRGVQSVFFLLVLFLLGTELATAQTFSLEDVLSEKVTIESLFAEKVSIQSLIDSYNARTDISERAKRETLNKVSKKWLNQLIKEEKLFRKDMKTKLKESSKNKHFYGDPSKAEDASEEQRLIYSTILDAVNDSYSAKEINDSTFKESIFVINSLFHLHSNYSQIAKELSVEGESETYQNLSKAQEGPRPSIHTEEKDLPFELRVGILYAILKSAFNFALENEQVGVTEVFETLSKTSGCLEARFSKLDKWHDDTARYFRENPNGLDTNGLKSSHYASIELVRKELERDFETYGEMERQEVIAVVLQQLFGKIGRDSENITEKMVKKEYNEIFARTPSANVTPIGSPRRSPGKKLPTTS